MYSEDTRGGWCCCLGAPDGLRAVRAEELARRHCKRAKLAMPLVEEIIEAALRFGTGGWRRVGSNGFVREFGQSWEVPQIKGPAGNKDASKSFAMRARTGFCEPTGRLGACAWPRCGSVGQLLRLLQGLRLLQQRRLQCTIITAALQRPQGLSLSWDDGIQGCLVRVGSSALRGQLHSYNYPGAPT